MGRRDRDPLIRTGTGEVTELVKNRFPCVHILKVCKSQCDLYLSKICVLSVVSKLTKKLSLENYCYNPSTILLWRLFSFCPKEANPFQINKAN